MLENIYATTFIRLFYITVVHLMTSCWQSSRNLENTHMESISLSIIHHRGIVNEESFLGLNVDLSMLYLINAYQCV